MIYASTRPFDDPALLIHTSWTPDVPGVTINLYQEGTAADGVTQTLKLVDTTKTTQLGRLGAGLPLRRQAQHELPGPGPRHRHGADLFFFTLFNQPMYLDLYNNGGRRRDAAAEQFAVQVLRRHAQLESAAAGAL